MFGVLDRLDGTGISQEDIRRARALSSQVAVVVEVARNMHLSEQHRRRAEALIELAREMDAIVDLGYVIIGSPDEVAEQLREVAVNLNVGNLMLLLQFGNMSKQLTKYNSRLFADQVIPKLKPLFAEWEHRWWPQPMDTAQRAAVPAYTPRLAAE